MASRSRTHSSRSQAGERVAAIGLAAGPRHGAGGFILQLDRRFVHVAPLGSEIVPVSEPFSLWAETDRYERQRAGCE